MITEDIETLKYNELNDLQKMEYLAILRRNIRKVTLQLMNSGDVQLASIFTIALTLATFSPVKLQELIQYASKLAEVLEVEREIMRRNDEAVEEDRKRQAEAKEQPEGENLDSELEQ